MKMLETASLDGFPLRIREIERIAYLLAGATIDENELVEPWATIVVAADGSVSTFSPELMEAYAPKYNNFVFGNMLAAVPVPDPAIKRKKRVLQGDVRIFWRLWRRLSRQQAL